jgi:hypothetical protein
MKKYTLHNHDRSIKLQSADLDDVLSFISDNCNEEGPFYLEYDNISLTVTRTIKLQKKDPNEHMARLVYLPGGPL